MLRVHMIEVGGYRFSEKGIEHIANFELGERSEAARRVLYKRERRQELMNGGMSFENACLVVNREMEV